jgi:hypothetical protein
MGSKQLKVGDLNKLFSEGESADREVFAEMRSNILLVAGEHHSKRSPRWSERIRDTRSISETQKLRLTKNHVHKISRHYKNNILEFAPGVAVEPKDTTNMQDEKDAKLNHAVWEDAVDRYKLSEKIPRWGGEFIDIGEVAVKVFFDPNKGDFKGYQQLVDEEGNPQFDEMGQPLPDEESPQFEGAFVFETIFGFNLIRPAGIKSMEEAPWLGVRKMVDTEELQHLYKDDPEKLKFIHDSPKEDFIVFDANKGEYVKTKNQVLVQECYWKPCYDYPQGYYYIFTKDGILEEGELPEGIFPIVWQGFDVFPTAPRGHSIIKVARPYQAEINRASSAMATHQITIGDDKLIYQAGTKLAPGALLPGVRGITFQGAAPQILAGRDGGQFLPYIEKQIEEMYDAVMMEEENQEMPASNLEPYTLLYTSLRQRKKYGTYGEKFERFLCGVAELYLTLAKIYLSDEQLLIAIGKDEQSNIPEFRKTTKLSYQVKIVPQNDTIETQLGKQMTFSHVLQYVGGQLDKDSIGKMIRNMPFSNTDESLSDLTMDYDISQNVMLAIERGEMPDVHEYENHTYMAKTLTARCKKPDFKFLPQPVQQVYAARIEQHEQILADQAQKLIDAKNEAIPTGGALIACDLYTQDPKDPMKAAKRARIPYQALDWLVQQLEAQGQGLEKLEHMDQATQAGIASKVLQKNPLPQPSPSQPGGSGGASWGPTEPIKVS